MRRKQIGVMDFHGSVDITDPCYEKDIWCRMNDVKIKAGTYTQLRNDAWQALAEIRITGGLGA